MPWAAELNPISHVDVPVVTSEMLMQDVPTTKNAPGATTCKVTDPVGVSTVPAVVVSIIVTAQVENWFTTTGLSQEVMVMEVVRRLAGIAKAVAVELVAWVESPL